MASSDPAHQEHLGRSVSNFNQDRWERRRSQGHLAKRSAPPLIQQRLDTADKFLAEASPYDVVWGVGFRTGDMRAFDRQHWPGLNLLIDI